MNSRSEIPQEARGIVDERGWSDETILLLTLRFIRACHTEDALVDYLRETADEERETEMNHV